MQSVSKGFLKLENVVFGEGVEDAVDVLVGEDCERHVFDLIRYLFASCFGGGNVLLVNCAICADRGGEVRGSDSMCRAD